MLEHLGFEQPVQHLALRNFPFAATATSAQVPISHPTTHHTSPPTVPQSIGIGIISAYYQIAQNLEEGQLQIVFGYLDMVEHKYGP